MPFLYTNSHLTTKPYNFDIKCWRNSENYDWRGFFGTKFRRGQNFLRTVGGFYNEREYSGADWMVLLLPPLVTWGNTFKIITIISFLSYMVMNRSLKLSKFLISFPFDFWLNTKCGKLHNTCWLNTSYVFLELLMGLGDCGLKLHQTKQIWYYLGK